MLQCGVAEVAHGHFHQDFCIGTVLTFLCIQVFNLRFEGGTKTRLVLSEDVAKQSLKKSYTARRIRAHECLWVKQWCIPESGQGKDARVSCFLEDNGTCLAMERYIARAGKQANSEGLAYAVIDYWHFLEDEFGGPDGTNLNLEETNPTPTDHELAPRTARE